MQNKFENKLKHSCSRCYIQPGIPWILEKSLSSRTRLNTSAMWLQPEKLTVVIEKNDTVKRFQFPTTPTHLKSFFGMCNVYRRLVLNFARVAAPLNKFLEGKPAEFTPSDELIFKSFDTINKALVEPPVQLLPHTDLPYSFCTDACNENVGFALM